jgi:hypothetical protein
LPPAPSPTLAAFSIPYPAYEGCPADAAGVLCNTRDAFIRETRKQCRRGVDLIKIADST